VPLAPLAALAAPPHPRHHHSGGISCFRFYLLAVQPRSLPGNASAASAALDALVAGVGSLDRVLVPAQWPPAAGALPTPSAAANATGLLSFLPPLGEGWCPMRNNTFVSSPFFARRTDLAAAAADAADGGTRVAYALDDELLRDLVALNQAAPNVLLRPPPCGPAGGEAAGCPGFILPDGAWTFHAARAPAGADPGALDVTIQANTAAASGYHRPNGVSRPAPPAPSILTIDAARLGAMDLLTRAFAGWAEAAGAPHVELPLVTFASTMAELQVQTTSDIVEILGAILFVILLSAPLPLFIFVHVTEKELRLNEMQMIMGVRAWPVQAVNYGVNACIYVAIIAIFWATAGGYMQLRTFAHTSPLLLVLTFAGHGLALTATARWPWRRTAPGLPLCSPRCCGAAC
jgi:hypothetical protein